MNSNFYFEVDKITKYFGLYLLYKNKLLLSFCFNKLLIDLFGGFMLQANKFGKHE